MNQALNIFLVVPQVFLSVHFGPLLLGAFQIMKDKVQLA